MTNYEQQLNKIQNPKGCGKYCIGKKIKVYGEEERDNHTCGKNGFLCSTCKEIQKAQKETLLICAKNELEFLEDNEEIELECETCKNKMFIDTCADRELCNKCRKTRIFHKVDKIGNRISQLQKVIKKLEEMK